VANPPRKQVADNGALPLHFVKEGQLAPRKGTGNG
jgi:hypothetical protein